MTTLIDVIVLLLAYAGLSLSCAGLIWLLRTKTGNLDAESGREA